MTVWMNSRRTIGSRPEVGSSSTSSSGSGQIAVMSASCVRCPFDRWLVFWRGSSRNWSSSARSVSRFQRARNDAK